MALALDPTLATAQDALEREPIVEVISSSVLPAIPFAGLQINPLVRLDPPTNLGYEETDPVSGVLSTGELGIAMAYGFRTYSLYWYVPKVIRYITTINGRSAFVTHDYTVGTHDYDQVYPGSVVPIDTPLNPGGAAVLWMQNDFHLNARYMILNAEGELVVAATNMFSVTDYYIQAGRPNPLDEPWKGEGPAAVRLQNGTYLAICLLYENPNFTFYKTTATISGNTFSAWSAKSALSIGGLNATDLKRNLNLIQLADGTLHLYFEVVELTDGTNELTNLYFSKSTDNGATWSAATKITNYTEYRQSASHPSVVEVAPGELRLAYDEFNGAVYFGPGVPLYPWSGDVEGAVTRMSFDPVNRKLYALVAGYGIMRIDVDTWEVDAHWDDASTPPIPMVAWNETVRNDQDVIAYFDSGAWHQVIVFQGEANTVTRYAFQDIPEREITANVTGWPIYPYINSLSHMQVDKANDRVYLFGMGGHPFAPHIIAGYLDLTETGPEYSFHLILDDWYSVDGFSFPWGLEDALFLPAEDILIITYNGSYSGPDVGGMMIYQISTGGLLKNYRTDDRHGLPYPAFPFEGFRDVCFRDGKIYAAVDWTSEYGQDAKRGVAEIDYTLDTIIYHVPTYQDRNDYLLYEPIVLSDGRILWRSTEDGFVLWNPDTGEWNRYSKENVPGLPQDIWKCLAVDEVSAMIYGGYYTGGGTTGGVWGLPLEGLIYRGYYLTGTESGGSWSWSAPSSLLQGTRDHDISLIYVGGGYYAFWENGIFTGYSALRWNTDFGEVLPVTDYLALGEELSIERKIDGTPNRLEFAVIRGNLFDPTDSNSLYGRIFKKGRKITVRFGERVSGVEYWQGAGSFLVRELKLTRGRETYPTMRIMAEDFRTLWEDSEIIATPYYENYPDELLLSFLTGFAGLSAGDVSLPAFAEETELTIQWLHSTIQKVVEQVCRRYGYYPRVTVDDKFSARRIHTENAVDHAYANRDLIVEWTPDDSYSDFTNRVVVVGQSNDYLEVTHNEESVKMLAGTVGWWGHKVVLKVYYSDDHTKQCRNPRLEIIESVRNFNFRLGGGGEAITNEDYDGTWVEITIEMPNLVGLVVADVAALVAIGASVSFSLACPGWAVFAITILLSILFYAVASVANYQYNIHARPLSEERRQIQGQADDLVHQAELGRVVQKKFDETTCVTSAECSYYAGLELLVARLQRNRVKMTKIAHLKDEEGDTITIPHPFSGVTTKIFATGLKRRFKIPKETGGGEGYFFDDVEGWVIFP